MRGCSGWNISQLIRQIQHGNAATRDRDCMGGVAGDRRLGGVGGRLRSSCEGRDLQDIDFYGWSLPL